MQSINVMNAKLEFKYAGTKTKVALSEPQPEIQSKMRSMRAAGIDLNDTFLSIYSLNGQYQQRVSWYNDNNESVGERNIDMREFVGYEKWVAYLILSQQIQHVQNTKLLRYQQTI